MRHIHYGNLQDTSKYLFPLPKEFQDKGYHAGARCSVLQEAKARGRTRDVIYMLHLEKKYFAVADGVIIDYYFYYWKTFALAVDHGDFSVVYGEVQPPDDPDKIWNYRYI